MDIGYFANVIDIGGIGLAICTDGVGSKSIIAQMMNRYDTIGIDCVAMNVNDAICVGARPISMVDYIAIEKADADILGAIAIGLVEGAKQAGISISGGEIAPLKDVVRGFDLVGMAVGIVPLDRIITGRDLVPGDVVIGLESSGIHSNGLTLARHVFFERAQLSIDHVFPELGIPLAEELLRPTLIYVPEILDIIRTIPTVKALINITGDGLLNLPRVDAKVGFLIDDLPPVPAIFRLIQQLWGRRHLRNVRGLQHGGRLLRARLRERRRSRPGDPPAARPARAGHRPGHRRRTQRGPSAERQAHRSWQSFPIADQRTGATIPFRPTLPAEMRSVRVDDCG